MLNFMVSFIFRHIGILIGGLIGMFATYSGGFYLGLWFLELIKLCQGVTCSAAALENNNFLIIYAFNIILGALIGYLIQSLIIELFKTAKFIIIILLIGLFLLTGLYLTNKWRNNFDYTDPNPAEYKIKVQPYESNSRPILNP